MKVSLGMVVRHFVSPEPLKFFLENAAEFGHEIHSVVVGYSHDFSQEAADELSKLAKLYTVRINDAQDALEYFKKAGISSKTTRELLYCDTLDKANLVPYGFNRNIPLIEAMITGSDVLIYVDSDVYPWVLAREGSEVVKKEMDFVGNHVAHLKGDVCFTSSNYSGYHILPPMNFPNMMDLLAGIQKESEYEYLMEADRHGCLWLQENFPPIPHDTLKMLGGNLGMRLDAFSEIPPFFSPHYEVNGTTFLGRGEDTIIGRATKESERRCVDIDLHIMHNTYGDYPKVPDIVNDPSLKTRIYYACTGWIGRNPFLNWLNGEDVREKYEYSRDKLITGASAIAKYLNDDRFLILPEAIDASFASLGKVLDKYNATLDAWNEFTSVYYK